MSRAKIVVGLLVFTALATAAFAATFKIHIVRDADGNEYGIVLRR